jgi:hypothetical protein
MCKEYVHLSARYFKFLGAIWLCNARLCVNRLCKSWLCALTYFWEGGSGAQLADLLSFAELGSMDLCT